MTALFFKTRTTFSIMAAVLLISLIPLSPAIADDLNDGIPGDDKLADYDSIKLDQNICFVERNAKNKAAMAAGYDQNSYGDATYAVQGGVVVRAGAKTGDITVIYDGEDNTVVSGN